MYPLNENTTELLELIRAKMEAKKAPWDKKNPKKYGSSVSKAEKKSNAKKSKHDGKSVLEMQESLEIKGAFPMGEATIDVLERIRLEMMSYDAVNSEASAGESEADNVTDVDDAFDLYLDSLLERMLTALNATEEQATEFIMLMADEMEEEGMMPPMPGIDASDDEVSMWMGAAKTCGFANKVLEMANAI